MAFECNLAAGNGAVCQHHVSRQAVEHQQVLPEILNPLQAGHENPQEFNEPEGAFKLQMLQGWALLFPGPSLEKTQILEV